MADIQALPEAGSVTRSRRVHGKTVAWLVAGAMAFAFIFWGVNQYRERNSPEAQLEAAIDALPKAPPMSPEEQAAYDKEHGEDINYDDFYVQAKSTGLPVGKRYRFYAEIDENMTLSETGTATRGFNKALEAERAFDDNADYQRLLRDSSNERKSYEIVASMGSDGNILIHKVGY